MTSRPRSGFDSLSEGARAALAAVVALDGGSWSEVASASKLNRSQLHSLVSHLESLQLVSVSARHMLRPCTWGVRYCGGKAGAKAYLDAL